MIASDKNAWMTEAACRGLPASMFYVEEGANGGEAKKVCAACPVNIHCAMYAHANREVHGIWDGTSRTSRRAKRAGVARRARTKPCPRCKPNSGAGYMAHRRAGEDPKQCDQCMAAYRASQTAYRAAQGQKVDDEMADA